jgi:DNA-directed RNA polymerase subunit RPC12/RpoP
MQNLIIKCDECDSENVIPIDRKIVCYNCKSKLFKNKNSFIKILQNSIIISGIIGISYLSYNFGENHEIRYDISQEYLILNACIDSNESISTKIKHEIKLEICVCTLKKIQKKFTSSQLSKTPIIFSKYFNECKLQISIKNPNSYLNPF